MPNISSLASELKNVEERLDAIETRQTRPVNAALKNLDRSSEWIPTIRDDRINMDSINLRLLQGRIDGLDNQGVQWREEWRSKDSRTGLTAPDTSFAPAAAVERFVETNLQRGEWMSTNVIVSSSGRVDGIDRTWCNNELAGFTGGRGVLYADVGWNILAHTPVVSYGVDGKWNWWSQSDRTDYWNTYLPTEVAGLIQGVYIFHIPTPRNRLPEIIQQIINLINSVVDAVISVGGTVRDARERLCRELPELCAVFSGALAG